MGRTSYGRVADRSQVFDYVLLGELQSLAEVSTIADICARNRGERAGDASLTLGRSREDQ